MSGPAMAFRELTAAVKSTGAPPPETLQGEEGAKRFSQLLSSAIAGPPTLGQGPPWLPSLHETNIRWRANDGAAPPLAPGAWTTVKPSVAEVKTTFVGKPLNGNCNRARLRLAEPLEYIVPEIRQARPRLFSGSFSRIDVSATGVSVMLGRGGRR